MVNDVVLEYIYINRKKIWEHILKSELQSIMTVRKSARLTNNFMLFTIHLAPNIMIGPTLALSVILNPNFYMEI